MLAAGQAVVLVETGATKAQPLLHQLADVLAEGAAYAWEHVSAAQHMLAGRMQDLLWPGSA